jgi:hypothetical protein
MVVKTAPYDVEMHPFDGKIVIRLPERECPRCQGSGFYRRLPSALSFRGYSATVPVDEVVTIENITCDHSKEQKASANVE